MVEDSLFTPIRSFETEVMGGDWWILFVCLGLEV